MLKENVIHDFHTAADEKMEGQNFEHLTPSESFFRQFQLQVASLNEKIEAVRNGKASGSERGQAVEQCQASITQLSNDVRNASSYIPAHDRRTYGERIKGLLQNLKDAQAASAPRQKFSFKSSGSKFAGRKTESTTASNDGGLLKSDVKPRLDDPLDPPDPATTSELPSVEAVKPQSSIDNSFSRRGEYVSSLPSATGSGSLSMLRRCIVNLDTSNHRTQALTSLTLKDIEESLIICGHVNGPIHLTSVSNSVIVVSCRQFRMHESRNSDLYLHTASRPIIENCSAIGFAPLPQTYSANVDEQSGDQWQEVDDFNWHRAEASPNWSVLDISRRVKPEMWQDFAPRVSSSGVEEILKEFGLSK